MAHRKLKNILYFFKGIKQVRESEDLIYYNCNKCGTELIGHKNYGKLRVVCKCGHAANVYTGKDLHSKIETWKPENVKPRNKKDLKEIDEKEKLEIFKRHIKSDLLFLSNIISNQRDVTKQAGYQQCLKILDGTDSKEGYEKIVKYLQEYCDLKSVSLNIVWEPLTKTNTLSTLTNETNILGTTYYLSLGGNLFYTIYLNPKYLSEKTLISTIAHELSHVYASHYGIIFKSPDSDRGDKEYSEQMTDLLGVVLGMGELMCSFSERIDISAPGYLSTEMVGKANDLWRFYLEGDSQLIKTLVICSRCSQKLKIPVGRERLRVVCPKCKNTFMYQNSMCDKGPI